MKIIQNTVPCGGLPVLPPLLLILAFLTLCSERCSAQYEWSSLHPQAPTLNWQQGAGYRQGTPSYQPSQTNSPPERFASDQGGYLHTEMQINSQINSQINGPPPSVTAKNYGATLSHERLHKTMLVSPPVYTPNFGYHIPNWRQIPVERNRPRASILFSRTNTPVRHDAVPPAN